LSKAGTEREWGRALLATVRARLEAVSPGKPLFLKIAPDLAPEEVDAIVDVAVEVGIAGLICTNTTLARPGVQGPVAAEAGGLSGAPLVSSHAVAVHAAHPLKRRGTG
jgi:dihydroorotate dehydrogenase